MAQDTFPAQGPLGPVTPSSITPNASVAPPAATPTAIPAAAPIVVGTPAISAAYAADLPHILAQVLTPANLDYLKIMLFGAGATAGKKAIELFVEQAKTWFSNKHSIEEFKISAPPGMTVESLKREGQQVVIILRDETVPITSAMVSAEMPLLAEPVLPMPVAVSNQAPSVKRKTK